MKHTHFLIHGAALLALSMPLVVSAQDEPPRLDANFAAIKAADEANRAKFEKNPDYLVLPGLLADKAAKRVTLSALSTGLTADDPVEFWITPITSGKDYEALSVTPALPSDLHRALEFIGLVPGRPVNYTENRTWPRGPRVNVFFEYTDEAGKPQRVRAERFVAVGPDHTPLPETGLMFVGSYRYKDEGGVERYAADMLDARAMAPNYNDPSAVLDVPTRSSQALVYGSQRANPKLTLPRAAVIKVVLEPADPTLADHTRDLAIDVSATDGQLRYAITDGPATRPATTTSSPAMSLAADANVAQLLAKLSDVADGKADVYATLRFDPKMLVTDVRKTYAVLGTIESDRGVRIDAPATGQLFQRAFFPDEEWRRREDRLGEPWELRLVRRDGKIAATLARWVDSPDEGRREQVEEKFDLASPGQFVNLINEKQSQWTKVVLVYPPADLTYGELLDYVAPALATFPRVFVFTPEGDPTTRAAEGRKEGNE